MAKKNNQLTELESINSVNEDLSDNVKVLFNVDTYLGSNINFVAFDDDDLIKNADLTKQLSKNLLRSKVSIDVNKLYKRGQIVSIDKDVAISLSKDIIDLPPNSFKHVRFVVCKKEEQEYYDYSICFEENNVLIKAHSSQILSINIDVFLNNVNIQKDVIMTLPVINVPENYYASLFKVTLNNFVSQTSNPSELPTRVKIPRVTIL